MPYKDPEKNKQAIVAWRKKNPDKYRRINLRSRLKTLYNITIEQYERLKTQANGKCQICFYKPKRLFLDHDHKTGKTRGLVCPQCNFFIVLVERDVTILSRFRTWVGRKSKRFKS